MLSFPPARCTWQNDVVSGLSKHHRSPVFPTSYPQLEEQLNGIKWRDGKRAVEEEEEEEEEKEERNGGKRKKGVGGTLDSCQMLIKAKERKTLVSACRKGVASREISHSLSLSLSLLFLPLHPRVSTSIDGDGRCAGWIQPVVERVPGFLSCGSYDGFTIYRLFVVMRPLCALVVALRWLCVGHAPRVVGDKK